MRRVRDEVGVCSRCGERFTPTRYAQAECRQCRRRRAVQRHAAKQLAELQPMVTALQSLRLWLEAEICRWEKIAGVRAKGDRDD